MKELHIHIDRYFFRFKRECLTSGLLKVQTFSRSNTQEMYRSVVVCRGVSKKAIAVKMQHSLKLRYHLNSKTWLSETAQRTNYVRYF